MLEHPQALIMTFELEPSGQYHFLRILWEEQESHSGWASSASLSATWTRVLIEQPSRGTLTGQRCFGPD